MYVVIEIYYKRLKNVDMSIVNSAHLQNSKIIGSYHFHVAQDTRNLAFIVCTFVIYIIDYIQTF